MALLTEIPRFCMDVVDAVEVSTSNMVMNVQGSTKPRPMGRDKAKKLVRQAGNELSKTIDDNKLRMITAMERKNGLQELTIPHCSLQKQASFWLKLGNKNEAK